jgi:hypothetical protein
MSLTSVDCAGGDSGRRVPQFPQKRILGGLLKPQCGHNVIIQAPVGRLAQKDYTNSHSYPHKSDIKANDKKAVDRE